MDLLAGYSSETEDNTNGRDPSSKRSRDGEASPHLRTSLVQTDPRTCKRLRLDTAGAVLNLAGTMYLDLIRLGAELPASILHMLAYVPIWLRVGAPTSRQCSPTTPCSQESLPTRGGELPYGSVHTR